MPRPVLLALAAALTLPMLSVPAVAAAPKSAVTQDQLLTVAQVDRIFPQEKGTTREVTKERRADIGNGCTTRMVKVAGGMSAAFLPLDLTELEGPSLREALTARKPKRYKNTVVVAESVVQFRTTSHAKRVLGAVRKVSTSPECLGLGEMDELTGLTDSMSVSSFRAPKVGTESAALSLSLRAMGQRVVSDIYLVRTKKQVVSLSLVYAGRKPERKRAAKLLRIALRQAR